MTPHLESLAKTNNAPVVLLFSGKDSQACRSWCTFEKKRFLKK
jgi:hypothetical protein